MNKWLQLAELLAGPVLSIVNPKLAPIAPQISAGIQEAEQLKAAGTITDKLAHVQNIANIAANSVNTAAGKTVVDTSSLNTAVQEGVDTAIAAINLIHQKATSVTDVK